MANLPPRGGTAVYVVGVIRRGDGDAEGAKFVSPNRVDGCRVGGERGGAGCGGWEGGGCHFSLSVRTGRSFLAPSLNTIVSQPRREERN